MCTFGDYLASALIVVHTANSLDLDGELEDESYESKGPQNLTLAWPTEIK